MFSFSLLQQLSPQQLYVKKLQQTLKFYNFSWQNIVNHTISTQVFPIKKLH